MTIKKSNSYIVGICSITDITDSDTKRKFDSGEEIEVTVEQAKVINRYGWMELVSGNPEDLVETKEVN